MLNLTIPGCANTWRLTSLSPAAETMGACTIQGRVAEVNVGKIAIAIVVLLVTFVGCEWYTTLIPPTKFGYAFFVSFVFLAVATALMAALKLPLLPEAYFRPMSFEHQGRIYRWTGIQLFVGILRLSGWERLWRKQHSIRVGRDALQKYSDATRGAEAVHVVAGICTLALTLSIGIRHAWLGAIWLCIANILVNLYPIMLQRYNRPRVERLIKRIEGKSNLAMPI